MITLRKSIQTTALLLVILFAGISQIVAQPEPTLAWAKKVGNSGSTSSGLVTHDTNGNTYVMVSINNTSLTIAGTTVTHTSGFGKQCIIKYDASGSGIWIKEIPFVFTTSANTNPHKFLYNDGKLYLFTAYRQNGIVTDGFQFPLCQNTFAGDLVLIQMDTEDGTAEWIRTAARPGSYSTLNYDDYEIYIDQEDNIHALGLASNTFVFDTGDTLISSGNTMDVDAFHVVYDTLGNVMSAHTLGVNNTNPGNYSYEYFYMDNQKNVYRFVKDTKTFIKYNEQGDTLFEKTFTSGVAITGMTVDPWQNVFLSGYFSSSTISFDGLTTSKTGGTTDAVLIKFNSNNGNTEWLKNLGDSDCDRFDYINSDAIGNVYVLNNQYGNCAVPRKSLLVKYNNDGVKIWDKAIDVATDPGLNTSTQAMVRAGNISLSTDGGTIILTGSYRGGIELDNAVSYGGNSENMVGFVAQYGICNTPQPTLTISNTQLCQGDSVMLSVTTTPGYDYLWSNGDTTNTTIYANSSGNYSVVAIQDEECYAESQEFYITENPLPDVTVILQTSTLTAVSGNSYQWLDCDNGHTPINGANQVSFTPIHNGNYAVMVTSPEGCTDTSMCITINSVGINEMWDTELVNVYPNPAKEEINIQSTLDIQSVRILDLQGKELLQTKTDKVNISSLSTGVYLIEIHTLKGIGTKKFIKE
ncbi:MAG: T9SS type A sorting domain-containing protein [Crocinitomicaceae bacterium]|nr:T9SS type A sorting domain-containing protein [Crocinitomicaceae bacterium]